MTNEVCLRCDGIERYLGQDEERVHALRGISLTLEAGTVHAVVGPSGCGKSTLLYILGLLDHPDRGQVTIGSDVVSNLPDDALSQKRNEFLGFIFQFHFLMEDFTAQENVMIPMRRLARLTESEMRERAVELLDAVGLGNKANRPSRHLSGVNSSAWRLRERWRTIRESSWPMNRQAISTPRIRRGRLNCCRTLSSGAEKLCSWSRTIRRLRRFATGFTRCRTDELFRPIRAAA